MAPRTEPRPHWTGALTPSYSPARLMSLIQLSSPLIQGQLSMKPVPFTNTRLGASTCNCLPRVHTSLLANSDMLFY